MSTSRTAARPMQGACAWQPALWFALLIVTAVAVAGTSARAQTCDVNQAQLSQAIVDSQTALDQVDTTLNRFDVALTAVDRNSMDRAAVQAARQTTDDYINALSNFQSQIQPIGETCGPAFTNDAITLAGLVDRFRTLRDRADALLLEHQTLVDSGEPAMTEEQRRSVQAFLINQGFYQSAIDGQFGDGTRASISAWQAASGYPATGYLTGPQAQQVLSSPAASEAPPAVEVSGLPAAPQVGAEAPLPDPAPPSAEVQRVCRDNVDSVTTATNRARDYRQDVEASLGEMRTALRAPRDADFDIEAPARTAREIEGFHDQLVAFREQARGVVGQCGDEYDASVEALGVQVDRLAATSDQAERLAADYDVLRASGEPALTAEEMRQVQQGLANRGHYSGAIDALFGPGTRNAIRAYQAEMGYQQTGYLTPQQVAELRRTAVTPLENAPQPQEPEVAEPAPSTIEPATLAADAAVRLEADLAQRAPLEPVSAVTSDDGQFGAWWWQMHDAAMDGRSRTVADSRYGLIGAAFVERGADSAEMVDALVLVGDAFARLGLYSDAELYLQRAYDVWSGLGAGDPLVRAHLMERIASVRLAQAVQKGPLDDATYADLAGRLNEVLQAAREGGADDAVVRTIYHRMADLSAAAGRVPENADVEAAFRARYRP